MSRHNVLYLLASLAVGAALLLGTVFDWGQLSAAVAALTVGDALLGALGLVLAAMTGAAGVLIAADVRADIAADRAWLNIHAEAVVIATPAETAPTDRVDVLYAAGPQDEGLRRILLAHRFMLPVPPSNGIESQAPECDAALARAARDPIDAEHQAAQARSADSIMELGTVHAETERKLSLRLVTSNAKSAGVRSQRCAVPNVPATWRIVNAGKWDRRFFAAVGSDRVPRGAFANDAIILAHRNGRHNDIAHRDVAPEPAITTRPACRGPPASVSEHRLRDQRPEVPARPPAVKPFREIGRPQTTAPAELVVTDNLGDRVPICEAELDVLEAYLEDVLRDVLGSTDTSTKPT